MNSSGIKRGLATTAVSALAVAGIPFIATSASAVVGDSIAVSSVGPVRNAGTLGGKFVFKTKGVDPAKLRLSNSAFTGKADNPNQSVAIVGTPTLVLNGAAGDSDKNDGLDEITAYISVTGASFDFGIYEDEDYNAGPPPSTTTTGADAPDVDAGEARTTVTGSTAGAPTSISVSPTMQSAPVGVTSGNYTATLKDGSGNTTQLTAGESVNITKASGPTGGNLTTTPGSFANTAFRDAGAATFTASGDKAGLYGIDLTSAGTPTVVKGSASLDVNGEIASGITQGQVDVVTGADTRNGFNNANTDAVTVRPDQASITLNINSPANANKVVILTATSAAAPNNVTFGGKNTVTSAPVTLNASGVGSVTITVDAASIQNGDKFNIAGSGVNINVTYTSPAPNAVAADSAVYLTAFKGTTTPSVTVKDQFGNPVPGTFVTYQVTAGPNAGAESGRVQVNGEGVATFSITDTKATAINDTDTVKFNVYAGQFDANVLTSSTSSIKYSADGKGADFLITVDGQTPGGAAYNVVVKPLTDTTANNAGDSSKESADLAILGGTNGATVTVTADNGGLVLKNAQDRLSQGAASQSGRIGTDSFEIVGTKAGVVNVTVTSGGKTQTGTVTVQPLAAGTAAEQANSPQTARNIAVSGPESVVAGKVVEYKAVITDAFGNPVRGFLPANINTLLTGPAELKGNSGASNAAGEIIFTVEINQDAKNPITFKVTGTSPAAPTLANPANDFGAAVNRLTAASTTDDGQGLSASENVASVSATVVNLAELEQAVEDAEEALADAQDELAAAQGDLDVAQTEMMVAQGNVDSLKAKKQQLRKKLNKAKANDNKQKAKTTRKKLRATKRNLRAAQDNLTIATAKVDAAQDVVDLRTQDVADAQADLDEAKQNLEDAQNG